MHPGFHITTHAHFRQTWVTCPVLVTTCIMTAAKPV